MLNSITFIFLILLIGLILSLNIDKTQFTNYVAPYGRKSQNRWWNREGWQRFGYPYYSFWETFEDIKDKPAGVELEDEGSLLKQKAGKEDSVLEYPPESPGPASLYNNNPYHLLSDELPPPREKEALSCVNSRSCYASDFERMVSKTGNYRQMTNNYKRGYPDSCSAPYQELVLNFYKADPMQSPPNNTGGSVSEAGFGLN